jgi:hypothetical protein
MKCVHHVTKNQNVHQRNHLYKYYRHFENAFYASDAFIFLLQMDRIWEGSHSPESLDVYSHILDDECEGTRVALPRDPTG